MKKDGHTDVASSRRMCRAIMEDVGDIMRTLPQDGEAELPTWWTNKLAVSSAYLNSARDYLMYSADIEEETRDDSFNAMIEAPEKSLFSVKNDEMKFEVANEEGGIEVDSYTTKHFDICPTAEALYKSIDTQIDAEAMDIAERAAKLQDVLFYMEKMAIENDQANVSDVQMAENLADEIMTLAGMMGLREEHDYVESTHVAKIRELAGMSESDEEDTKEMVVEIKED
jgi:hypothetical protein